MRALLRTGVRVIVGFAAGAGLLLLAGFLWFVQTIAIAEPERIPDSDGIVALTGGANRLADAARLLAEGRAQRLLISGVHPATTRGDLARTLGVPARVIECCVDLDYAALDTVGNAEETRKWARSHGFRSLIVVTSAYHMPRSLAELRHRAPDVALVPYPVVGPADLWERWWANPDTLQLVATEYVKYLYAAVRRGLATTPATVVSNGSGRPA